MILTALQPKSNDSHLPWTPPPAHVTKLAAPMFELQSSLDSLSPARSAFSYSMIEADITDPEYTPPSSEDRDRGKVIEKVFTDDSFDSASFISGRSGPHAKSRKTHSVSEDSLTLGGMSFLTDDSSKSYARPQNNFIYDFNDDFEMYSHGVVPEMGNTPPPSPGSGFEDHSSRPRWTGCDCSPPCWTAQEHRRRIAEMEEAWNGGAISVADGKNDWGMSASTQSSFITKKSQRGWHDARSQSSDPLRGYPAGCSPNWRERAEADKVELETDHADLRERIWNLEERVYEQAADMEYYQRQAQRAEAKGNSNSCSEDRINGVLPNDMDLVRSCVAGFDISPADRSKAMSVLSALQLEKTQGATSTAPAQKAIQEPASMDTAAGRIETQLGIMSRDVIKLKAYEKFHRMQEDSDRLARIESKLSDTHLRDTVPVLQGDGGMLEDLRARLTKLEDISKRTDGDSDPALLMLRLTKHFDELERRVSSIEDDDNAGYSEIRDDLSRLEKRFHSFKHRAQNMGHSEKYQSSSNSGAWECTPAVGRNSSSVGTVTSSGYLRKDQPTSTASIYKDIFASSDASACQLSCCRKSNISGGENGGWGRSASGIGSGPDHARTRRSDDWPSRVGFGRHSAASGWNNNGSNRPSVKRDGWGFPISDYGFDLHGLRKFSFPKSSSGDRHFGGW